MSKRLSLCLLLWWAAVVSPAQQPVLPARANVAAYDDENAISKLAYRDSPYFLELSGSWEQQHTDSSIVYSRPIDVEKVWREFRVYLNVRGGRAVRVSLDGVFVGRAGDSRHWNEFLLSPHLKYGRPNTLTIEALKHSDEALLERSDLGQGLNGNPFILFKNDPGIDDFVLQADYDVATATGTLAVDARIFNGKKKGKYYLDAEIWSPNGRTFDRIGRWVVFDKTADATLDLSRSWNGVTPWSAENPALYTLVLRLRNENMDEEEVVGARFGFRTVEVKDGRLQLNGKPITLKGITYGIGHTDNVAYRERVRQDLLRFKRNNINAVRTAGYSPIDRWFYEQCDALGLYVVCDANLMPVSTQRHAVATDKDFIPLFERRVENLYGEYKNHTSIIAWSLGDSRDNGVCMQAAYRRLKAIETRRPVLFSGADYSPNTDLVVVSKPKEKALRQALSKGANRPLLLFAAVSDTNFADMDPLWTLVENNPQLQGGFVDTGYLSPTMLADLKGLYSPFDVRQTKRSLDEAEFVVYNRNDFADFSAYILEYTIFTNLRASITAGDLPVAIAAGGAEKVTVPIPPVTLQPGEELFVRFDLAARTHRVGEGHLGSRVFLLQQAPLRMQKHGAMESNGMLDTVPIPHSLVFLGHGDWRVDTIGTTFRRPDATTYCRDYMLRYTANDGTHVCDVRSTYTVFPSGDAVVDYSIAPAEQSLATKLVPAVRVNHGADSMAWFGLDREVVLSNRNFAVLGIFDASANSLRRTQVRWCAAHTGKRGLFMQLFGNQFQLCNEGHTAVLVPDSATSHLRLRLRPYHDIHPQSLTGVDFPRMDEGMLPPPDITAMQSRFTSPMNITLSCPSTKEIRYTLDGSEPTPASPLYTKPFTIASTTVVKARAYAKGLPPSFTATRKFSYDYIASVAFSRKPSTPYNAGADTLLFDGIKAGIHDLTKGWVGFSGDGATIDLRLSKSIAVDCVVLRFAHSPQIWAFSPVSVGLSFSQDGTTYTPIQEVETPLDPASQDNADARVVEIRVPVQATETSFVKITAHALDAIPAWHRAKGLKPWLLMDEVEIIEK